MLHIQLCCLIIQIYKILGDYCVHSSTHEHYTSVVTMKTLNMPNRCHQCGTIHKKQEHIIHIICRSVITSARQSPYFANMHKLITICTSRHPHDLAQVHDRQQQDETLLAVSAKTSVTNTYYHQMRDYNYSSRTCTIGITNTAGQ